jgi:L-lactate dehydrogenase (cytochrome)
LWGLTAGGKQGVQKTFEILKTELDRAMGLLGVGSIQELKEQGPSLVKRRDPSARDFPDRAALERGYGGGVI